MSKENKLKLGDLDWKSRLSTEEYFILREKGTEPPGSGEYDKFYPKKEEIDSNFYFACRACGNPLFTSSSKFNSGCGWPAFDKYIKDSIETHVDRSFFMDRIEIVCAKCDGHLGHVFKGEQFTSTNERHCVNSLSIKYVKEPLPEEFKKKGETTIS